MQHSTLINLFLILKIIPYTFIAKYYSLMIDAWNPWALLHTYVHFTLLD